MMMVPALLVLTIIASLILSGPATPKTQLFENPETFGDDPDSWTIQASVSSRPTPL